MVYPGEFRLFPYVQSAINDPKNSGKMILSFTNQPGIARGEVKEEDFEQELKNLWI